MNTEWARGGSTGKVIWGCVLAALLSLIIPFATVLGAAVLWPVLMLSGIFLVFLQCYGGWLPAGLFVALSMVSSLYTSGQELMWMNLVASILPGMITLKRVQDRSPFFETLGTALIAYVGGVVAAAFIANRVFGGDLIAKAMDMVRDSVRLMPDNFIAAFVDALNSTLSANGLDAEAAFTVESYRAQMLAAVDLMQQTYTAILPATLLTGSALSAVLSTLWGSWTLARTGRATNESFAGMSRWFLPGYASLGALGFWIVGYVLSNTDSQVGGYVFVVINYLAGMLFIIQGLSALDRRMLARDRSLRARRITIWLLAIGSLLISLLSTVLVVGGIGSALYGSHGCVRLWLEKKKRDSSDGDSQD